MASVQINMPVLISGVSGKIGVPCALELVGKGSLALVDVQLETESLVVIEGEGAKGLMFRSSVRGWPAARMRG